MSNKDIHTNELILESSTYLQQHAHNPVNWKAWSETSLNLAKQLNKPILLSIGYSSCHWCHVMEKESFEKNEVAEIMNEYFVCIKLDREERPDIDQIYMDAVQLMGKQGGWPLNVFLTPDCLPFFGGTYFPTTQWMQICESIGHQYKTNSDKIHLAAKKITNNLAIDEVELLGLHQIENSQDDDTLNYSLQNILNQFDNEFGGYGSAPKFPIPSVYFFLTSYLQFYKNEVAKFQLENSLDAMAFGGIFDHVGAGFARYSTDSQWFVPHFEKMLYDNAQLLYVYSEGYKYFKHKRYKNVVYETIACLENEFKNENYGFYSAIDADSEGEEGKFYYWSYNELENLLKEDTKIVAEYYQCTENGNWEHNKNILHQKCSLEAFCSERNLDIFETEAKITNAKKALYEFREKRIKPQIDTKILCSWNALLLTGLCKSYEAFQEFKFYNLAENLAKDILQNFILDNGKVMRTRKIEGFLDDYAFVIQSFTHFYQISGKESYLLKANDVCTFAIQNFYDFENEYFYYSTKDSKTITRKKEIFDSVQPSSNSVMAENLLFLSLYFQHDMHEKIALKMLNGISDRMKNSSLHLAYWSKTSLINYKSIDVIVISGEINQEFKHKILFNKKQNMLISYNKEDSKIPLNSNKPNIYKDFTVYYCSNKTCNEPTNSIPTVLLT